MKAAVIENYGGPEVFKLKEIEDPSLGAGEIMVRNKASSVNPIDVLVRQGVAKVAAGLKANHVLGSDFAGVVVASENPKYQEGDEVFGFVNSLAGGAYAEYVVASEQNLFHKPAGISFTEAASLPLVGCTAWQGMVKDGGLDNGHQVLVLGCAGGVGTAAVQVARSFAAEVSGTCSKNHLDFARELGCSNVWPYENEEVPEDAKFDLIFDASGKFTISDYKENLKPNGVFVSTRGGADSFSGTVEAVKDFALKSQMKLVMVLPDPEDLEKLKIMVEEGHLKPIVAETFGLDQLMQAHQKVEEGGFIGKIAVEIT